MSRHLTRLGGLEAEISDFRCSRDKRGDCVQVVIALIVTPDGFPIAYEVMAGNTTDKTTLADFLKKIETQYGKADRIWIIFISFLSYCLQVTPKARLKRSASGLTPRAVLEKFAAVQLLDVHLPTTDGREIVLTRYTQPEKDLQILLHQLQLTLPEQAPPKVQAPVPSTN